MRIRRGSVTQGLATQRGGGEAAQYMTTGATDLTRARWVVDSDNNLILDSAGEPMVLQADGNAVIQSDAVAIVSALRTTELTNDILVY